MPKMWVTPWALRDWAMTWEPERRVEEGREVMVVGGRRRPALAVLLSTRVSQTNPPSSKRPQPLRSRRMFGDPAGRQECGCQHSTVESPSVTRGVQRPSTG